MIVCVIINGGLCNRMRVIASTIDFAKKLNTKPLFVWLPMPDMNASFKDLFSHFPYTIIEVKPRGVVFRAMEFLKRKYAQVLIDDDFANSVCKVQENYHWLTNIKGKRILVWTCENYMRTNDFSMFQVSDRIVAKTIANSNTIGVHIRRTDNEMSKKYSPTSSFVEEMNSLCEKDKDVNFYLSTDDKNEERVLIEYFGDRIHVYEKRSLERNSPIGIEDALIDLYNLSRCKYILGSYYSSFSDVSADWGGIEKKIIKR